MATAPRYPALYQINTRVWLNRLSREAGKRITLADIDDATLDGFAEQGFDWIWLLSVWQIGAAGRAVSRGNPQWRAEFMAILPDLTEDDICGSGFAITAYTVSESLGGESGVRAIPRKAGKARHQALARFRAEPYRPRPSLGEDPSRLLCRRQRGGAGHVAAQLSARRDRSWTEDARLWPRSEFSRLARHLAAQLRQCRTAGGAHRRADRNRRQVRRRALRHGNAAVARDFPAHLGHCAGAVLAEGDRSGAREIPCLHLYGRSLLGPRMDLAAAGLSNIATTSGSTTACGTAMPGRSAVTCSPASTIRTSSRAFSKITTSPAPRPNFPGRSIRRRRSSPICRPACAFFIRASSRARGYGCRHISAVARSSRTNRRSRHFTPSYCRS